MPEDVLSLLRKRISAQSNLLSGHLSTGSAKDMEEYRTICGKLEGLAWLEREIVDLESKLESF
jgi:hypothetical protein|tara:strand:+ start:743 stop:931 length:189 start_codon:yes stop_codon:yes gene_type:complete